MDDGFQVHLAAVAQPGDTLIFQVDYPATLTQEQADVIRAQLAEKLPGIKSLFLAGGLKVGAVVRSGDEF